MMILNELKLKWFRSIQTTVDTNHFMHYTAFDLLANTRLGERMETERQNFTLQTEEDDFSLGPDTDHSPSFQT
jgi:hypothetical protein